MLGIILLPFLILGCFALMKKGFSDAGIPLTSSQNLTGTVAKVLGIVCGLLGLVFLAMWLMMVMGSLMS